jgi:hypothetical protein
MAIKTSGRVAWPRRHGYGGQSVRGSGVVKTAIPDLSLVEDPAQSHPASGSTATLTQCRLQTAAPSEARGGGPRAGAIQGHRLGSTPSQPTSALPFDKTCAPEIVKAHIVHENAMNIASAGVVLEWCRLHTRTCTKIQYEFCTNSVSERGVSLWEEKRWW